MRGWWWVWSTWWSAGGQCDDARLVVGMVNMVVSWWSANGQLVVSMTMRGWWWVRSTWWSAGGQLMVSWWSV